MRTSQTKRVAEAMSGEQNDMVLKESMKPRQRTSRSPHSQQELAAAPPQSTQQQGTSQDHTWSNSHWEKLQDQTCATNFPNFSLSIPWRTDPQFNMAKAPKEDTQSTDAMGVWFFWGARDVRDKVSLQL